MTSQSTAHHEETKDHEGHEAGFVQSLLRALRAPSWLREKASLLVMVTVVTLSISCGGAPVAGPPARKTADPAPAAASSSTVPHGDHNPHHGGLVMMKGEDLHYEVVLDPSGREHRVYFTDAVREELPASVASDVALTIKRPSAPDESVGMQIDDAGESWVGRSGPIGDPARTTARLAFSIRHEPYWIDLPFKALR